MQIRFSILFLCSFLSLRVLARPAPKSTNVQSIGSSLLSSLEQVGEQTLSSLIKTATGIVTRNQVLTNGSSCATMTVLFARGTDEPGNVGLLTGPPLFEAIADYMNGTNQLAIQGVNYDASVSGFLAGGSTQGATTMAGLINMTLASCPDTTLMLSGYSQGAQVVHLATAQLPANTTSKISSVVLFGDPKNGTAVSGVDASKVLSICHTKDDICQGGEDIRLAHLSYGLGNNGSDVKMAAAFALGGMANKGITSMFMDKVAVGQRFLGS
ncbi:cutinase-domain-containing protein [Coleophoma crateriformis]|uniref:cutinase n=1 Tax=Coleophoma crateriformis TaxID=565419 RepID=A0A3D8T137_9HELO|nr:cutinase-domain-containing protein [Coleophoma crateriformis]